MKAQVNLSQILQGGLAALVGWLFKTVNDLQQEVSVLKVQIDDAKEDLLSLAMREQELNSAITEILIKLGGV
jgi:chromosome segregation ATPase|tara:strand:+ start:384 stop:599 length:216 start_codon:yes stop_codon:yes gene_type:complete